MSTRPQIPDHEFTQILGTLKSEEDKALLNEWYVLDKNAVPPERRLKPRERKSEYEHPETWQPVESRLHAILAEAIGELKFSAEKQLPYVASATEQEINAGALSVREASDHVFCFFRSIEGLPQQFDGSKFVTLATAQTEAGIPGRPEQVQRGTRKEDPGSYAGCFCKGFCQIASQEILAAW